MKSSFRRKEFLNFQTSRMYAYPSDEKWMSSGCIRALFVKMCFEQFNEDDQYWHCESRRLEENTFEMMINDNQWNGTIEKKANQWVRLSVNLFSILIAAVSHMNRYIPLQETKNVKAWNNTSDNETQKREDKIAIGV